MNSMMMKLKVHVKHIIKKYWWIALVVIVFLVPRAIDYLYFRGLKLDSPNTFLSAGDLLTYYGSIIAMVVAILGVVYTIKAEQEKYHDDVLKRVMPYIAYQTNKCDFKDSFLEGFCDGDDTEITDGEQQFKVSPNDKVYLIIQSDLFVLTNELSEEQRNAIEHSNKSLFFSREYINVGVGTAVNLNINVHKDNTIYCSPVSKSLLPSQSIKLGIFINMDKNADKDKEGEYVIDISYYNIYGDKYSQKWLLGIYSGLFIEKVLERQKKT